MEQHAAAARRRGGWIATGLPDADEVATILYNQVSWTDRHLRAGHGWAAP